MLARMDDLEGLQFADEIAGQSIIPRSLGRGAGSGGANLQPQVDSIMDEAARVLGYKNLNDFSGQIGLPVTSRPYKIADNRAGLLGDYLERGQIVIGFGPRYLNDLSQSELVHHGVHELIHVKQLNIIRQNMFNGNLKDAVNFWEGTTFFPATGGFTRTYFIRELGTEYKALRAMQNFYGSNLSQRIVDFTQGYTKQQRFALSMFN